MFSEPIVAVMLIFALLAFGEFLSVISKARIPMLFVVLFGYLILLWTGIFPQNIIEQANLAAFAALIPAPLIVHMGTLIPFKQIKEQYKAVLIALSGIVVASILILLIAVPIIGYTSSIAGTGPLTGGIIAFVVTSEKLQELGLVSLITIPALILGLQNFIGMPLSAYFLRKYGFKLQKQIEEGNFKATAASIESGSSDAVEETNKRKSLLPEKYQTQVILLFQIFLGGAVAVGLGSLTGVNYSLWALVIGIGGTYFGFYQGNMLERANSFGISMSLVIILVMTSMNSITISMFADYLPHVLLIMTVGVIGILIGGFVMTKLFKWDPLKGMPIALTALYGFPGDYILCEEVSRSVGKNKKEQRIIFDEILTPMLVGGFTTVTTASILIASILVSTLG
ncbi:hypothetical protein [Bacillus fonticola]|uniref:hypothetical protein n=1 Tax=Bacillus fonticola TaxID=2728853 RepID=UPI001474C946|nr:hypothetical protein [Bacillus fonticola]